MFQRPVKASELQFHQWECLWTDQTWENHPISFSMCASRKSCCRGAWRRDFHRLWLACIICVICVICVWAVWIPFLKKNRQMQITCRDTGRTICLHLSAPEEEECTSITNRKNSGFMCNLNSSTPSYQLIIKKKTGFGAKALKPPIDQTVRRSFLIFINMV